MQVFGQDGTWAMLSLCRRGVDPSQDCSLRVTPDAPSQSVWMLRDPEGACLAACMDAPGVGCQPSTYDTAEQRLVVFYPNCSVDGVDGVDAHDAARLWWWDGLLLRNLETGWCLDPVLAQVRQRVKTRRRRCGLCAD